MTSTENGNDISQLIPIDVIIMIFSMLDLKSIARCRCVSKLWASILRRPDFTELFLSMSCSRTPKLLFVFEKNRELLFFSSPHRQNPNEISFSVVSNNQMKFSFYSNCEDGDLVHGLICLEDLGILKICNPSTRQTLMLPKVKTHINCVWWSLFGYDPIAKQYKILSMRTRIRPQNALTCDDYQVLTIGSGKMSWKTIECCIPHRPPHQKICINGVVYFTTMDWLREGSPIICFDVRFEKFSFIQPTEIISFLGTTDIFKTAQTSLVNYNGKLGLLLFENVYFAFFDGKSIRFKLWVLEDLEKQLWSVHSFIFPTIVKRVFLNFVGLNRENEIVLSSGYKNYPFYLFYLNLEKKTIVTVEIQGIKAIMEEDIFLKQIFLNHVENVNLY